MAHNNHLGVVEGQIIQGRWRIEKFIREGLFHSYYFEVVDLERPIKYYTMKIESNAPLRPDEPPRFIVHEKKLLSAIKHKNGQHFVGLEAYGETNKFNFLIINSIGPSVADIEPTLENRRFTLRTCLHIARKSLYCIEEFHYVGFLHRDIKPANYYIGKEPDDLKQMYLGNFEMCRQYLDDNGRLHRPRDKVAFRGSPRYASVNALEEHEQSRADDIWAWFFSLVELSLGKLPWDDQEGPTETGSYLGWLAHVKDKYIHNAEQFLHGCPAEYNIILHHLMTLTYDDKPNYSLCLDSINRIFRRKQYTQNIPLDWEPKQLRYHRKSTKSTK